MHEAEVGMMLHQLRNLFVRILIHCHPLHPNELWEEFKDAMAQDYTRHYSISQVLRKTYIQISIMLSIEGSSFAAFQDMEQITDIQETEVADDDILPQETTEIGVQQYEMLNEKQKEVFDLILNASINNNDNLNSTCFYIHGPGSNGKTFIYTTLYYMLRSHDKKVCAMAFTGIAATLLPNGKTVHRTFALPVPLFAESTSNIKMQSKESE